jgi:hypothetical protein
MWMTGHFNSKSVFKCDQTLEAHTRAAQCCVADNISYPRALELETKELSDDIIKGFKAELVKSDKQRLPLAESSSLLMKRVRS